MFRDFYVVTAIFNPFRYQSHYANYRRFAAHMAATGVTLVTVEMAFGERPFVVTDSSNPNHVQVRGNSELWLKENLLNLGVQRLPANWKYVAWIDCDIEFARAEWAHETVEHLQHYDVVQPWSDCYDLGPQKQHLWHARSFCRQYITGRPRGVGYEHWHPGYAWACTRYAWDTLGGLLDSCVVGSADNHMAWALLGEVWRTYNQNPQEELQTYSRRLDQWEANAAALRRNIGYVEGSISHYWHGPKANRRYLDRWQILTRNKFDPDLDLRRNSYGVFELTDRSIGLRDDIRAYFRARNDDANVMSAG